MQLDREDVQRGMRMEGGTYPATFIGGFELPPDRRRIAKAMFLTSAPRESQSIGGRAPASADLESLKEGIEEFRRCCDSAYADTQRRLNEAMQALADLRAAMR
jgi:hypothetical protein